MNRRQPPAVPLVVVALASMLVGVGAASACVLEIGESGLGNITTDTPFDRTAIATAVPGCRVDQDAGSTEGEPVDVMVIRDGSVPRALVFPDWSGGIFSLVVESETVRNRLGPSIGTSYALTYPAGTEPVCIPGVEDSSGRVLCPASPGSRLTYLFDGSTNAPDGALPPSEELAAWRIVAFVWRPIPFEDPRWVDVGGFDPGEGPSFVEQVKEAVDDPPDLARLVLYPVELRSGASGAVAIPDPGTFALEYARRLTPAFVAAIRDQPTHQVTVEDGGASLGDGRIRIAPVCASDTCVRHRTGIVAVSMF